MTGQSVFRKNSDQPDFPGMWVWLCLLPQGMCNDPLLLLPTHSWRLKALTFAVDSCPLFIREWGWGRELDFWGRKDESFAKSKITGFRFY